MAIALLKGLDHHRYPLAVLVNVDRRRISQRASHFKQAHYFIPKVQALPLC